MSSQEWLVSQGFEGLISDQAGHRHWRQISFTDVKQEVSLHSRTKLIAASNIASFHVLFIVEDTHFRIIAEGRPTDTRNVFSY
jgi:hypothetical protein